jgi:hypothetical protein
LSGGDQDGQRLLTLDNLSSSKQHNSSDCCIEDEVLTKVQSCQAGRGLEHGVRVFYEMLVVLLQLVLFIVEVLNEKDEREESDV